MDLTLRMEHLVDTYFSDIVINNADYELVDDCSSDAVYVSLTIPTTMLNAYLLLKDQHEKRELPDAVEFWTDTGLEKKLREQKLNNGAWHIPHLNDALDYLKGNVQGDYRQISTPGRILLKIYEVPEVEKH